MAQIISADIKGRKIRVGYTIDGETFYDYFNVEKTSTEIKNAIATIEDKLSAGKITVQELLDQPVV